MTVGFERDPGLQSERTALAWRRTSLAVAVNAVLALRTGMAGYGLLTVVGVVLLVGAVLVATYGFRRGDRLVAGHEQRAPAAAVLVATVLTTWLAAVAACVQITGLALEGVALWY